MEKNNLMNLLSNTTHSADLSVAFPGPAAGDDNKSQAKRKRLTQACDACRKKKVKCSGEKPSCQNCQRFAVNCTYLPSTKKRGPRVGLVESLEKRLQQMEKLLQPLKEQGLVDQSIDSPLPIPSPKRPRLNSVDSSKTSLPSNGDGSLQFDNVYDNSNEFVPSSQKSFSESSANTNSLSHFKLNTPPNGNLQQKNGTSFSPVRDQATPDLTVYASDPSLPSSAVPPITNTQPSQSQGQPSAPNSYPKNTPPDQQGTEDEKNSGQEEIVLYFGDTSVVPGFTTLSSCHLIFANSSSDSGNFSTSKNTNTTYTMVKNIKNDPLPLELVLHLADCFFLNVHQQFPMFHEATFRRRIEENRLSPFLVHSFCAVSARFSEYFCAPKKSPHFYGDTFAEQATSMILGSFDQPTVDAVQGFILLALHSYGLKDGPRSWMYVGMGIRMAQELGLYKEFEGISNKPGGAPKINIDNEAAFIERESRRRTFWGCLALDRVSSCALGRPTIIDEADIEIRFPMPDRDWENPHPVVNDILDGKLSKSQCKRGSLMIPATSGLFACHISAAVLLGRIAEYINRRGDDKLPPHDPNSDLQTLQKELDEWYQSLSPNMQWSEKKFKEHHQLRVGAAYASVHLLYHATVVVLNRPNVAMLHTLQTLQTMPQESIDIMKMSAQRCSASARSATDIANLLIEANCCHLCPFSLYPIFAIATIHINDAFSEDEELAENARRCLVICQEFIKMTEPYWAMGSKLHCMLMLMYKQRAELRPSCSPFTLLQAMCGTDCGLMELWNQEIKFNEKPSNEYSSNLSIAESNLGIQSCFLSTEMLSPRVFMNDISGIGSWSSFLRSPSIPLTPRTPYRFNKRDYNADGEYIGQDYFSQDVTLYNPNMNISTFSNYDALLNEGPTVQQQTTLLSDYSLGRAPDAVKYIHNNVNGNSEQMPTQANANKAMGLIVGNGIPNSIVPEISTNHFPDPSNFQAAVVDNRSNSTIL